MCTYVIVYLEKIHCLFYCTMTRMSTMESYTHLHICIVHPVLLYVPWTRWMYICSTMEFYCPFTYTYVYYSTIHPILLYHGQVLWNLTVHLYTYMYIILLSLWGASLKMLHNTHVIRNM